jgi:branched-chain amino acid transport system ATP-binding protein
VIGFAESEVCFRGENIHLRFGGITALRDVSYAVRKGTLHAVIGPNGAGKTSLFNVITGFYRANAGDVFLEDQKISGLLPDQIARAGIARTFQNVEIFSNMTVLENVVTGGHLHKGYGAIDTFFRTPRFFRRERALREQAEALLDFVGLADLRNVQASQLPYGLRRLLEIARALGSEPKILLLDEPAAGLNMKETTSLGGLLRRIVDRGITVLLVEHDMDLVMDVSDRILVMNFGEVIAEGTSAEVQQDKSVIAAYLGEDG